MIQTTVDNNKSTLAAAVAANTPATSSTTA